MHPAIVLAPPLHPPLGRTESTFYSQTFSHTLTLTVKGKGSLYSITQRRVPELIPVLGSQPAGNVSHKPGGRLPLLSARPGVTLATGLLQISLLGHDARCRGTMGVNSLPKTVTRQRRGCDLNPDPLAPESSTLTTRLPSHLDFNGHVVNDSNLHIGELFLIYQ